MSGRKLFFLLILLGAVTIAGCNKDEVIDLSDTEYLIFGHFYGECIGEQCVEIFKLDDNNLWEDTNDRYPGSSNFYSASFIELPDSVFQKVNDLGSYFPTELLDESKTVIGMPDAGDWGGFYIEYKSDTAHRFWLIDKMKSNVPEYLYDFIDEVNLKISLINS